MDMGKILTRLPDSPPGTHRFAHQAMATTFEILIAHSDAAYAEQAAWAAFEELDRLERQLSRYIENSDISRINILPANKPLRIGLDAFKCLELCTRMCRETNGAFDVTVGSLLDLRGRDKPASEEELNLARQRTGMRLIELDEMQHMVRLRAAPLRMDLGGVGKGYAIDRMAAMLRDWNVDGVLIHSGHSSVLALHPPPGARGWAVTLSDRSHENKILAHLTLRARAISGSGLRRGRHIVDPRTAMPVEGRQAAWCSGPTAAITDALSTAFMVMTPSEIERYCSKHPDILAMIVVEADRADRGEDRILRFGDWEKVIH
jgi:thiamine biosynthesis lipoprotein